MGLGPAVNLLKSTKIFNDLDLREPLSVLLCAFLMVRMSLLILLRADSAEVGWADQRTADCWPCDPS